MKKWSAAVITAFIIIVIATGCLVVVVDPYFHYHAPLKGISYRMGNEAYMNDGASKHFTYDSMITGTSTTRGFLTGEAERLFGGSFVRMTFQGEGFKRINDNLKMAIEANSSLKFVIRGVDPIWFVTPEDWNGYDEYPDYLYDDNLWNDVHYLYNMEILTEDVIPVMIRTIKGMPPKNFDDLVMESEEPSGRENVLKEYIRPEKNREALDAEETEMFFKMLQENMEKNVISTIRDNPDIMFYIFIPPYSICWWDSLNQNGPGVIQRRIEMEEYVINQLLYFENVHVFSFSNNFDLTCDLDHYIDDIHYTKEVCSQMLVWMKEGQYEVTKSNCEEYTEEIADFYENFDYDSFFETENGEMQGT